MPINLEVPEILFDTKEQAANYCPLEFHRNWVSQNRPVIFRGAVKHWPAFKLWQSNEYFRKKLRDNLVTVSITPNGYADAALPLHDDSFNDKNSKFQFVMPHEEQMTVEKFLDILEASPGKGKLIVFLSSLPGYKVTILSPTGTLIHNDNIFHLPSRAKTLRLCKTGRL